MKKYVFQVSAENFKKIPGSRVAYWVGDKTLDVFGAAIRLADDCETRKGLATSDNDRFLRLWYEVGQRHICYDCQSNDESEDRKEKWYPYNKGGSFRKWYGNNEFVVNWWHNGYEIRNFRTPDGRLRSRPQNLQYNFSVSLEWTKISSERFSARLSDGGALFDDASAICHHKVKTHLLAILGFLNSISAAEILCILNPTNNVQIGDIGDLPVKETSIDGVSERIEELITLSRADWDEYETSWDFKVNPLVREGWQRNGAAMSMGTAWAAVFARRLEWAERMKTLEEENNRLFIEAYGLQDELKPDVAWKDVSITGNPAYRYKLDGDPQSGEELARADAMRELISYGMGVLMGRYSLEQEGLILASQGELYKDYIARVHGAGKILPDEDGVIPAIALEGGFFKDNLLHRMREFLSAAFGNDALPQNLNFIEAALGCGFDKYLTDKFFDDHVKTYKKRPIYWLFESPKGYFRAFAYMHRMTGATAGHIRNNYLLPYIGHLEKCFAAEVAKGSSMTSAERKRVKVMEAAIKDCKAYDLVLHDFADRAVAIDLDDGVVVNWKKYESVLAKL